MTIKQLVELSRKEPKQAIVVGEKMLIEAQSAPDSARIKLAIAWAQLLQGEYDKTDDLAKQALITAEQYQLAKLRAEAINIQGAVAYRKGRYSEAETFFHKSLAIAEQYQLLDRQLGAHSNLGNVYRNMGEPVLALDNLYKALQLGEKIQDPWRMGVTQVSLGLIYKENGQYSSALSRFDQARSLFRQAGNELSQTFPLGYAAEIYQLQGKYEQALKSANKAHQIWLQHNAKDSTARSLLTLAKLHRLLLHKDQAQQYLEDAKQIYEALENGTGMANYHLEAGQLALDLRETKKAQQHFRNALTYYSNQGQQTAQIETLNLIAESWLRLSQPAQAEKFLLLAGDYALENAPVPLLVQHDLLMAKSRFALGRRASALPLAERAAIRATEIKKLDEARQSYLLLSDIYQQQGEYKKALEHYQLSQAFANQLRERDQNKNLQLLRAEHQLALQAQQLEKVNAGKIQAELALAQQKWQKKTLQGTIAVLCILLCLISALVYQSRRLARFHEERSLHDPLTKLGNRRFLEQWLGLQLPIMQRRWFQKQSTNEKCADTYFLMIDLDHFKQVNDSLGHAAGDEVLAQFSQLCNHLLRDSDQLVRIGGEEFLLVAQQIDGQGAAQLAEKIRRVVARHSFIIDGQRPLNISCTLGFAPFPLADQQPEQQAIEGSIMLADRLLYEAKSMNRNAWLGLSHSHSWKANELIDADMDELYSAQARGEVVLISRHGIGSRNEAESEQEPVKSESTTTTPNEGLADNPEQPQGDGNP
ncbi:hypothetical protein GCM10025776_33740 [Corallincola platygyrae]